MFYQTPLKSVTVIVILAALALYAIVGGYFAGEIVVEIAVLAILAISLDFVAGYGGMVSLCHGAIAGIGAYTFAGLTALMGFDGFTATIAALVIAMVFGLLVGAVTANISGIFFIMATLAFGQMAYVVVFEWKALGGDDGLSGGSRYDLSAIGLNMNDSIQFALFCLLLVLMFGSNLTNQGYNPLINPFNIPNNVDLTIWEDTVLLNRVSVIGIGVLLLYLGLRKMERRERLLT